MPNKLLAFTPSTNQELTDYVNMQLLEVKNILPELDIEHVSESDERYYTYRDNMNRFPCFIMLKNEIRKAVLLKKVDTKEFVDWVVHNQ